MTRFADPRYTHTFVDANIYNDVADGQDALVAEIVRLSEAGEIPTPLLAHSVQAELNDPNTPASVRKAALDFTPVYTKPVSLNVEEQKRQREFIEAAQGHMELRNIERDLMHLFEAYKYGAGYFITRDRRLLDRRKTAAAMLQVEVLLPADFIARVNRACAPAKASQF